MQTSFDLAIAKSIHLQSLSIMMASGVESHFFSIAESTSYEFALALVECTKLSGSLASDISDAIEDGIERSSLD